MLPELAKVGYQTWLNTGGADFHPSAAPTLNVRIDRPATFTPPDWDHDDGDKDAGMPMPENKRVAPPPKPEVPRNLVYIMRFPLAQPVKSLSIVTFDHEDFIRFEVDKASLSSGLQARQASDLQIRVRAGQAGLCRQGLVPPAVKS